MPRKLAPRTDIFCPAQSATWPSRACWHVVACTLALCASAAVALAGEPAPAVQAKFVDLSLLVAPNYPATWPVGLAPFQINHYERIGALSPYNSDILTLDENTGTQFDSPTHSVAPPDSKLPNAGLFGLMTSEKVPAWQFGGEACVVDCRGLLDSAPNGRSDLVTKEYVIDWEKQHRSVGLGDVVLFRSGYSDKYYRPFPAGRRFIAEPVAGKAPGWPDPDPDCMEYLAGRKVMTLGTDSPSMGPIPDLAEPTHFAGLKHGMVWTEGATDLGELPASGAFYCMLGPKFAGGIGGPTRAFAIVGDPLAKQLIASTRNKNVTDLSVLLTDTSPVSSPGAGVGRARYPHYSNSVPPFHQHFYAMDSHTGTHLVPPAYALPAEGFKNSDYAPEVREWLAEYEKKYGPRGTSDVTCEKVPLSQTCGWARIIDVSDLVGSTQQKDWPASPEIKPAQIEAYEKANGPLEPGEIVIFRSGHSDKFFKPLPQGKACFDDPLNGRSEGWPAPGPDAVMYLAKKGIRCIGTDGPTLGGVDPRRALMTYWALGSQGMAGVEYLTNAGKLPGKTYFLFAALKIQGCHGGPGRAIALY